ncbi:hypothetical protein MKW92_050918 [Papaver armeniacum]|nr:hypothetical protein MKW92_050918 [Papaver armeniacum]
MVALLDCMYDYVHPGCAGLYITIPLTLTLFVSLEENMLEVDCPCVTPELVLQASGHVEKFTDLVKDLSLSIEKVQELKHVLAMLVDFSPERLGSKIKECGRVAPDAKNPLFDPYPFNLMFLKSIGPSGTIPGRQIHPKYSKVVDLEFLMFPREIQMTGKDAVKLCLGDAVAFFPCLFTQTAISLALGTMNNETLGYLIGRVYLFLTRLGISKERLCGIPLVAHEKFSALKEVEGNQKKIVEALHQRGGAEVKFQVCTLGKAVTTKSHMVSVSSEIKKEHQTFILHRSKRKAGDEQLNVLNFPPVVAPFECTVFPLVRNPKYEAVAKQISNDPTTAGISHRNDITGTSIGKRYARTDELGVPFAVTVDTTTTVTIRERDSKDQIRVQIRKGGLCGAEDVTDGQIFTIPFKYVTCR